MGARRLNLFCSSEKPFKLTYMSPVNAIFIDIVYKHRFAVDVPALSFENLKMQIAEIEKTDACQRLGELFGALPRYDNFCGSQGR